LVFANNEERDLIFASEQERASFFLVKLFLWSPNQRSEQQRKKFGCGHPRLVFLRIFSV